MQNISSALILLFKPMYLAYGIAAFRKKDTYNRYGRASEVSV